MKQKQDRKKRPPAESGAWDGHSGAERDESDQDTGSAVEDGVEILDNSTPMGPWKDAYSDFFRRD